MQRTIERISTDKFDAKRVKITDPNNTAVQFLATRKIYRTKVVYAITWAVQKVGEDKVCWYVVESQISLKQALHYQAETMRLLNMHSSLVQFKQVKGITKFVDTSLMIDAEHYADTDAEMYGYGSSAKAVQNAISLYRMCHSLTRSEKWAGEQ